MDYKRRNGLATVLIIIGALLLLGLFGPLFGKLLGLVFPIILIALGYYGIRRGKVLIGWIVLAIGILSLIGKLAWLIGPILGIVLLIYGISLFKNRRRNY
ncbi:LiaF transmembrane domain-containing protein [Paenibacillus crassostreae]|uniref:LiaF transmembrane domain-containing protein n=1 Tax=Paenibacillus crassostreae TaxID=1763538 RepID=A0A162KT80_9BACL|nr:hypothetical protein [Paenibacillus crassostreae]AOZ93511.1 hypothetical protein LPB68_15825 [Paenibacillus crassostreae]OAB73533.1 hypothetical protein PNBC_13560 [Paenibacillus crassostreae]